MKHILLAVLTGICILGGTVVAALAYVEPSDVILDQDAEHVYMIGWVHTRLTALPKKLDDHAVYSIDLKSQSSQVVYKGHKIDRLELSSDGKYVSFLQGYESFVKNSELTIVDVKEGKEAFALRDDFRKYEWSPDGKKIAYITGENIEGRGLYSTGVWVYDISKRQKRKIAEKANDVEWLSASALYIINDKSAYDRRHHQNRVNYDAVVYDNSAGTAGTHAIKGMTFSLDGNYSIVPTDDYRDITADRDATRIEFYDVKMGRLLPAEQVSTVLSEPSRIIWSGFVWLKGNRVLVQRMNIGSPGRDLTICDIENNSILKSIKGAMVGVNKDRSKIVVFVGGRFAVVDVP